MSRPAWLSSALYPFQSRYFNLRGCRLHYIDEGQGVPIVFSHPAVGWSFMYRALIKELKVAYRCIAIDYPGFGLSDTPKNYTYTLREQGEALEALLHHLQLNTCIVLAHDTGGASAFSLALRRPNLVSGLILTDTLIFPVQDFPFIANFLQIMDTRLFGWLNRHLNLLMQVTTRFGFKTITLSKAERRVYLESFRSTKSRDAILKILLDLQNDESLMQDIFSGCQGIWNDLPTLLMCGEKDKLVSGGVYDRIKGLMGNLRAHLIPGEDHFPHEGQATLMAQHIRAWMEQYIACQRA